MRKLLIFLVLFLAGCSQLPADEYDLYPRNEEVTPGIYTHCEGEECWTVYVHPLEASTPDAEDTPTPEAATPAPTTTLTPQCEIRVLEFPQTVFGSVGGVPTGTMPSGTWAEGIEFYYESDPVVEWVHTSAGWLKITENVYYDPLGPCIDLPATFEEPLPPTLPPPTPGPTPTPEPTTECVARNNLTVNINVRESYSTGSHVVRALEPGQTMDIGLIYDKSASETWAYVADNGEYGWIALWYYGPIADKEGNCSHVEVVTEPPFEPVLVGVHVLPGEGAGNVLNHDVALVKCLNGTEYICGQAGTFTIYRTLITDFGMIDCPEPWMYSDPSVWWYGIRDHLPPGYDAYEIQNECGPPPQGYEHWAEWSIELALRVEAEKGGILLAFSFAAGNPDYLYWEELAEYLQWVDRHGQETGIWHGVALHQAVYAPWSRPDMPWVNNEHLAGRHLRIRELLLDRVDIQNWPGLIILTEAGLSDGYSGNWRADYTCEEAASALAYSAKRYEDEGIIDGIAWWNIGQISIWTSDHHCLRFMFGA